MPKPRRLVEFTQSSRAVVHDRPAASLSGHYGMDAHNLGAWTSTYNILEDTTVMATIDKDVRVLVAQAKEQGWDVLLDKGKLKWWLPDRTGNPDLISSPRVVGRGLANLRADLRRLGLDTETDKQQQQVETTPPVQETHKEEPVATPVPETTSYETASQALAVVMTYMQEQQSAGDANEWQQIAEQAEQDTAKLNRQLTEADKTIREQQALLTEVKQAMSLPSWEVLPTIARLLGISTEKAA